MQFGTPEQDAFRRDFTINSLFYNINEGRVEDFTGRGIDDMRQGIIRTPLPAKETFLDGEDACYDVNAVIAVWNDILSCELQTP